MKIAKISFNLQTHTYAKYFFSFVHFNFLWWCEISQLHKFNFHVKLDFINYGYAFKKEKLTLKRTNNFLLHFLFF